MSKPLGLYISVPFCRAKCTFCNFASGAFAPSRMPRYIDRLCQEIATARTHAAQLGAHLPDTIDTLYFGGGTPSLLSAEHVRLLFSQLRSQFSFAQEVEITLECAPGQLADASLEELLRQGMNRISLGVQSFVDRESAAVGRLHTEHLCRAEIARLRAAGIPNINLDLIVGLPHQTEASWHYSLETAIAIGAPHISVYMLEVDNESRLGQEMLAEGSRYSASEVPSEDETADWYQLACDRFEAAGVHQYEISNFAREGHNSQHNLKYWHRDPYLGLGLDAHSMLNTEKSSVRFANTSDLNLYSADTDPAVNSGPLSLYSPTVTDALPALQIDYITQQQAFEESLFLGLRLNAGIRLSTLREQFGQSLLDPIIPVIEEIVSAGLLVHTTDRIALTDPGRVASSEVFSRLVLTQSSQRELLPA